MSDARGRTAAGRRSDIWVFVRCPEPRKNPLVLRMKIVRFRQRWGRALAGGIVALLGVLLLPPVASASFDCGTALSRCRVQLDNFGRAWFESGEKLTEDALGDGTLKGGILQIYQRVGNQTVLVSRRPDGQPIAAENQQRIAAMLLGVSSDGERVYIKTDASLAPEDLDAGHEGSSQDGYVLSAGAYSLFSTGPLDSGPNPNPFVGSQSVWASDDGGVVYFETGQQLVPEDWDAASDVYQRANGQTRLVSTGPDQTMPTPEFPNPNVPETRFLGATPDGLTAFFSTAERLTEDDTEKLTFDIFSWRDGVTRRLTRTVSPEEDPNGVFEAFDPYSFGGSSEDGSIYFTARGRHVPEDTDTNSDIYRARPDGSLERVIASPPGAVGAQAFFRVEEISRDGSRLFIFTGQALVPEDQDLLLDIYRWSGGSYQLVSPQPVSAVQEEELHLCSVSADGARAYFRTWGSHSPRDTDEEPDVYEWSEGTVRLVSPASDGKPSPAFCSGISPNGRFVAFATWENFVPGDNDAKEDIYVVDMGAPAAAAAADARRKPARPRHPHNPRLVTAEGIAPRMGIARVGVLRDDVVRLRLRCPKSERSGPCRGRVKLLSAKRQRVFARGTFRIGAGRKATVLLRGRAIPRRAGRALVRVRGADMLGNRRTLSSIVRLRRARE
jgi:hypothetical protein